MPKSHVSFAMELEELDLLTLQVSISSHEQSPGLWTT